MRVIEHHEVPCGKVYGWRPERIVFARARGETLIWVRPMTVCGAVHTGVSRKPDGRRTDEKPYHRWLEEYEEWRRDTDNLRHEYFACVEAGSDD